jgi:hypothetical protein
MWIAEMKQESSPLLGSGRVERRGRGARIVFAKPPIVAAAGCRLLKEFGDYCLGEFPILARLYRIEFSPFARTLRPARIHFLFYSNNLRSSK